MNFTYSALMVLQNLERNEHFQECFKISYSNENPVIGD